MRAIPSEDRRALPSGPWVPLISIGALAALVVAALLPATGIPGLYCPFRWLTGLPCAGCGFTRSVVAAAHGEWGRSVVLHPLGPPFTVALLAAAASGLLPRQWRLRLAARLSECAPRRGVCGVVLALLVANLLFRFAWILTCQKPSPW